MRQSIMLTIGKVTIFRLNFSRGWSGIRIRSLRLPVLMLACVFAAACGTTDVSKLPPVPPPNTTSADTEPTPQPTPKNGEYPGKGKVTKIKMEGTGSVELNHQEIVGVMPAMLMEFFVTDKAILKGIAVGDEVNFTLKYEDGRETISKIEKVK